MGGFLLWSCVLAATVAGPLPISTAEPVSAPAPVLEEANCDTHLIYHYDAFGQLESVEVICFGLCDTSNSCEVFGGGTLFWCQCDQSGAHQDCLGFATSEGLRCVDVLDQCEDDCIRKEASWVTPETGKQHTQYWCSCE